MKIPVVLPLLLLMSSCIDLPVDSHHYYQQFNFNDLQYLITDKFAYYNIGDNNTFEYPLRYLVNGKDTIDVVAKTEFFNHAMPEGEMFWVDYYELWGISEIYIQQNSGFKRLKVIIIQDTLYNTTDKTFSVCLENTKYYMYNEFLGNASDSIPLDTADIRGNVYQSVFKIEADSLDKALTKVKSYYYARSVGFIRVETVDGKVLELLKGGSANRQYPFR